MLHFYLILYYMICCGIINIIWNPWYSLILFDFMISYDIPFIFISFHWFSLICIWFHLMLFDCFWSVDISQVCQAWFASYISCWCLLAQFAFLCCSNEEGVAICRRPNVKTITIFWIFFDILWYSLMVYDILLYLIIFNNILRYFVIFNDCCIFCYNRRYYLIFHDSIWYSMIFERYSIYSMIFHDIVWYSMISYDILWNSLIFISFLWTYNEFMVFIEALTPLDAKIELMFKYIWYKF